MTLPTQRRPFMSDDHLIDMARNVAGLLLTHDRERLRHSAAVAARAAFLAQSVDDREAALLIASAWLHDVGYAADLEDSGFHPLDGARHLRSTGWDSVLCGLVAHHSGSRFVAHVKGLDDALAEFEYTEDPVSDALTIADQTVGPNGRPFTLEARMREMLQRHGPESPNAPAHPARAPYLRAALQRVNSRLGGAQVNDPTAQRAVVSNNGRCRATADC